VVSLTPRLREQRGRARRPFLAGVISRKGGGGKSVTSLCLADGCSDAGLHTMLVDADPQATLTAILLEGKANRVTLGAYLRDLSIDPVSVATPRSLLMSFVPGDHSTEQAVAELGIQACEDRLGAVLVARSATPDVAIIDTPGYLGAITDLTIAMADMLIIPTRVGGQGDMSALGTTLERIARGPHRSPAVVILPTNYAPREASQAAGLALVSAHYGAYLGTPIPHSAWIERAANVGQSVMRYAPKSNAASAYRTLIEQVVKLQGGGQ